MRTKKKSRKNPKEKDDSKNIGYQDLLFNSGVACILLFIIFSVNVGGKTIAGAQVGGLEFDYQANKSIILERKTNNDLINVFQLEIKDLSDLALEVFEQSPKGLIEWNDGVRSGGFADYTIHRNPQNSSIILTKVQKNIQRPVEFRLSNNYVLSNEGPCMVEFRMISGSIFLGNQTVKSGIWKSEKEVNLTDGFSLQFDASSKSKIEQGITWINYE